MSNYSSDRDALKAIVKILSPHCPSDVRNALARKLAESARGSSFENLAFRFSDIGHLFHPDAPAAAADALARDIRAARESGELQSIIPREQGHIAPLDLLTWPQCPPVSAENPLSYWLPVGEPEVREPAERPQFQQQFQESEILRIISELGYNAKALPKNTPGGRGAKAEVRALLSFTPKVFDKAWERLRNQKDIQDAP